jgi:hypothetical protein
VVTELVKSLFRRPLPCFTLLLILLTLGCAQQVSPPPPPPPPSVISQITSAKKIFVDTVDEDSYFVHDIGGGPNLTYVEFYAALKQWGHFQLVDSYSQADLIFDIEGTEELPDIEHTGRGLQNKDYTTTSYPPMLNLSILTPSQDLLYKIVLPAGRARKMAKGKITFAQSIDALMDKVKALVAAPAPTQNP